MREEDLKDMKAVEEILEKELKTEMAKIKSTGAFAPGQVKTITEAVCLMLKMREYEEWLEDQGVSEYSQRNYVRGYGDNSYASMRSTVPGRFASNHSMNSYEPYYGAPYGYAGRNSYERGYSGHSTKDRMISRLEDMMGEAKNEYEAQMIRDTIAHIQSGN